MWKIDNLIKYKTIFKSKKNWEKFIDSLDMKIEER
jgi:hypothetical protein